jgi:hypothetical protein
MSLRVTLNILRLYLSFPSTCQNADWAKGDPSSVVYEIKPTHSHGLGMFATRDLKQGELVLRERPLLVSPTAYQVTIGSGVPSGSTPQERQKKALAMETSKALRIIFDRMLPNNKESLMALHMTSDRSADDPVHAKNATNAFKVDLAGRDPDGSHYSALCKEMSRINHR